MGRDNADGLLYIAHDKGGGNFKDCAAYKNGKAVKPKVTVHATNWDTDDRVKLKAGTDYTVV